MVNMTENTITYREAETDTVYLKVKHDAIHYGKWVLAFMLYSDKQKFEMLV